MQRRRVWRAGSEIVGAEGNQAEGGQEEMKIWRVGREYRRRPFEEPPGLAAAADAHDAFFAWLGQSSLRVKCTPMPGLQSKIIHETRIFGGFMFPAIVTSIIIAAAIIAGFGAPSPPSSPPLLLRRRPVPVNLCAARQGEHSIIVAIVLEEKWVPLMTDEAGAMPKSHRQRYHRPIPIRSGSEDALSDLPSRGLNVIAGVVRYLGNYCQ